MTAQARSAKGSALSGDAPDASRASATTVFSSAVGHTGNRGQIDYTAANDALDTSMEKLHEYLGV